MRAASTPGIRAQSARSEEALLAWQKAVLVAVAEVEDSLLVRNDEAARAAALARTVDHRRHSLQRAQSLQREGQVDLLVLLDVQRSVLSSELRCPTAACSKPGRCAALQGPGWRLRIHRSRDFHRFHRFHQEDLSVNRTFPFVRLAAIAAACAAIAACSGPPAPTAAPHPVFVTTVTQASSTQTRAFTAVVHARVETDLGFRTGGKVVERFVEVGDTVKAGQVLARLDPGRLPAGCECGCRPGPGRFCRRAAGRVRRSAFSQAVVGWLGGCADHERQKARADAAAARLDHARRQLELARNREGYASLVAPYAGVVTAHPLRARPSRRRRTKRVVAGTRRRARDRRGLARGMGGTRAHAHRIGHAMAGCDAPVPLTLRELSPLASAQGRTFRARYAATARSREQIAALPLGSTMQ
jgi:biotin carboxyl carrier protein